MLRPWELNLTISRESPQSIHRQLSSKLIHAIQTGAFSAGLPLPGTRELSQRLGINRKTVMRVYDELTAQGWLYTEDKRGTFVSHLLPVNSAAEYLNTLQTDHFQLLSDTKQATNAHTHHLEDDGWIDLNYPYGDPRVFNFEALVRATRHAIITTKRLGHQKAYQPHGLQCLRKALAQMLNFEQGLNISPNQLCIAPTARISLDIVTKALMKPGDYLLIEACHDPAISAVFQYHNILMQTVKHHANSIDFGDLEKLCINYPVRGIYLAPHCDQPCTAQMSTDHQLQLLALAKRYDFYVIEDNTAAQFVYEPMPSSMASISPQQVIHIGSLAHLMSASYKAAYMATPARLLPKVAQIFQHVGDGNNLINELTLTELLLSGEVKKQLKRAHKIYQDRRDHCCKLLQQELGDYVLFNKPSAGFSIWVQLHKNVNAEHVEKNAKKQKVNFNLDYIKAQNKGGQIGFSLFFAHLNHDEITLAIKRLKLVFSSLKESVTYAAYG